jgi:cysteine dioxygenase
MTLEGAMKQQTATDAHRKSLFPKLNPLLSYLDHLGERADLPTLRRLLEDLDVSREDLAPACLFEKDRYQRNLVKETPWYELVCLCWGSGQRTPIHDHEGSSCAFLVVEGDATETRFEHTPSGLVIPVETHVRKPGFVCASSEADIHQVANTQREGCDLITLHIYSPQLRHFNVYTMDTPTACGSKQRLTPTASRRSAIASGPAPRC